MSSKEIYPGYQYDEPLGIYGHQSQKSLAQGVISDLVLYEEAFDAVEDLSDLPDLGIRVTPAEKFRISSIVESQTAPRGYALAIAAPNSSDRASMGGIFYRIDRQDPFVLQNKGLVIARPETFESNQDYQVEVDSLMNHFEKTELEAIMRMLGKMTTSIELANKLAVVDEAVLEQLSIANRMRVEAELKRTKEILRRTASVESFVLSAVHNQHQADLNKLFPADHPLRETAQVSIVDSGREHILDWQEFLNGVKSLFHKNDYQSQPTATMAIEHADGDYHYVMRFQAAYGDPIKVQLLRESIAGKWQVQEFDLSEAANEDNLERLRVDDGWDQASLIECIERGEPVDDEFYQGNLALAAEDPTTPISKTVSIDYARRQKQKRRAA